MCELVVGVPGYVIHFHRFLGAIEDGITGLSLEKSKTAAINTVKWDQDLWAV